MIGNAYRIPCEPSKGATHTKYDEPIPLPHLQHGVGGLIEAIPRFYTFKWGDVIMPCRAFCNSQGKLHDMTSNPQATLLWREAQVRDYKGQPLIADSLVGPVLIVWGDPEFMRSL